MDGASVGRARRSVIKGFVSPANDMTATVVGEGVEQLTGLEVLRGQEVDAARGYLLGRPTVDPESIRNGFGRNDRVVG